jgi:hypothetical protein
MNFYKVGVVYVFLMSGKKLVARVMSSGTLPEKLPRGVRVVVSGGDDASRGEVVSRLKIMYRYRNRVVDASSKSYKRNGRREYSVVLEQF